MKTDITVIAITLNEERNLQSFIDNIKKITDKIFIVDSYSNDKTVDIALSNNIEIVQHKFIDFGNQWNFAIKNNPFKTKWVMKMDPDEKISNEMKKNIENCLLTEDADGYEFDRRIYFLGKKLNIKQKVLRIWKNEKCIFSDSAVNETPIIDGIIKKIKGEIDHYDSPDLFHWFKKQNHYSSVEAISIFNNIKIKKLDFKRKIFINFFIKLPFRYNLLFLYFFIIKLMFLSGYQGYIWCKLRVFVYSSVEMKYLQIKANNIIDNISINKNGLPDQRCKQF